MVTFIISFCTLIIGAFLGLFIGTANINSEVCNAYQEGFLDGIFYNEKKEI